MQRKSNVRIGYRANRPPPRGAWGWDSVGSAASGALVPLLVAVPSTSAGVVRPSLHLKAPFVGVTKILKSAVTAPSGQTSVLVANSFNQTSGLGATESESLRGVITASTFTAVNLTIANVTPAHSRVHKVSIVWDFTFDANLSGGAHYCNFICFASTSSVTGFVFANVAYSTNATRVAPIGAGTSRATVVNTTFHSTGSYQWKIDKDNRKLSFSFTVRLILGMSCSLTTGCYVTVSSTRGFANLEMGGDPEDHSQLVSVRMG
jgi:hypothetical protein